MYDLLTIPLFTTVGRRVVGGEFEDDVYVLHYRYLSVFVVAGSPADWRAGHSQDCHDQGLRCWL